MRFIAYSPDQGYLLPPNVQDILGPGHLCFFIRRVVDRLDLSAFLQSYDEEGRPPYHPAMMVSVWLYAYALGLTSSRRLEQRIREDLGFRYLAGGQQPDFWTLNDFRRRHPKALNDLFTQVLELARAAGLGRLGHVAIDSTRIKANAAADRVDSKKKLRSPPGRAVYRIRKALVEPVFGVLKEQRGMRQLRRRGRENVAVEWSLATTAYNLTRWWNSARTAPGTV